MAVALRNPELAARAYGPVSTDPEVYRRAAAEELLQARALALATMQRSGVLVVDVEPGAVVSAVLSRYLEVKYRGLV